jgi:hypothetical protein
MAEMELKACWITELALATTSPLAPISRPEKKNYGIIPLASLSCSLALLTAAPALDCADVSAAFALPTAELALDCADVSAAFALPTAELALDCADVSAAFALPTAELALCSAVSMAEVELLLAIWPPVVCTLLIVRKITLDRLILPDDIKAEEWRETTTDVIGNSAEAVVVTAPNWAAFIVR